MAIPAFNTSAASPAASRDRVVIVGAGIMGASIAFHLAKRGARVTILEQRQPGAGATSKSFAWINASFSKQPRSYYELNLLGIAGWRRLTLELDGDLHVQWGGSVQWFEPGPQSERLARQVRDHQQWGYPIYLVNKERLHILLPPINPGPAGAICFTGIEGTLDPTHALKVLLARAQQYGARLQYPCAVTTVLSGDGRVRGVNTTQGPIEADFVVLASGVDTPRLARMLEFNVPLKESPGVLAHSKPLPQILDRVALAPGANIKQNPDGRIVTGTDFGAAAKLDSSRDFGLKLLQNAAKFCGGLQTAQLESVTLGYRVLPQDGHPIVGFVQRFVNLYIAAMHSGITLAPIIGQLAAMEILDGVSVYLLTNFRLARFA
jgi:glycine/D-amino acid oxidase-like deaminating enzyme